jgi:hypothetical protein
MSKRTKTRDLKSSTSLSKSSKKDMKIEDLKVQPPKVEPIETVDPLEEIANVTEQFATEASHEVVSAQSTVKDQNAKHGFSTGPTDSMFRWPQQAKLLEMAEANTRFILRFVDSFTRARSPYDLLALTAAFSKEGTMLFQQQSSAMLSVFVSQPGD